jgi:hypothetical protein
VANEAYVRGSSTGTGRNLAFSTWAKRIEVPAWEKMKFISSLDEGQRPYGTANIRYWDTPTAQTILSTAGTGAGHVLSALTVNTGTPSVLTFNTTKVYCVIGLNDDLQDVVEVDLEPGMRDNAEQCVADACEGVITALVSNLTAGFGESTNTGSVEDCKLLAWQMRIQSPAVMLGERTIHACLHPGAGNGLTKSSDWMNAEIRGDAENPSVSGVFLKASGILFRFTTKMPTANGNGGEGAIYVPEAFAVGWNQRPKVEVQRSGLANFVIVSANLGGRVKWDSRARYYRTVVTV